MDYQIVNNRQGIRLKPNGTPETCSRKSCDRFEYSKAKNILDNLPKHIKRMGFKVEAIPEIKPPDPVKILVSSDEKELSENITRWIEVFGQCQDTINEAKTRVAELNKEINTVNKEYTDLTHEIEIEPNKDLYHGWLKYKQIQKNRIKRRELKDEKMILENVLDQIKENNFDRRRITKMINGLKHRKYTYRVIEEVDEGWAE